MTRALAVVALLVLVSAAPASAAAPPAMRFRASSSAASQHSFGQLGEYALGVVPAQAGIGDALAVGQCFDLILAGGEFLRALDQMALDHDSKDLA